MRWTVKQGDVLERLREMPDASVQCVVTSPPYWGLRDYGTAPWEGGGETCGHVETPGPPLNKSTLTSAGIGATPAGAASKAHAKQYRHECPCGARRIDAQLGLEPTPDAYVAKMVEVFREVKRVLRDDWTLWLNLGDSYAANRSYQVPSTKGGPKHSPAQGDSQNNTVPEGLKPKDLVGIPWRVAFALQADGWYLRSDIIWAKPNPMPESVTDRPTKSHEYVFLLTKNARYFFDQESVREAGGEPKPCGPKNDISRNDGDRLQIVRGDGLTRNTRSVWTIATQPFPEAHFATYPEELVERCIKAGTSERGACSECGAPWERVTERVNQSASVAGPKSQAKRDAGLVTAFSGYADGSTSPSFRTTGWAASCKHSTVFPTRCHVLDPFTGSGTTGAVSIALGRSFVGIELNPAYVQMARKRIGNVAPLIAEEVA